ncbi:hypothetical protein ES703_30203 [subsurface metagenome]
MSNIVKFTRGPVATLPTLNAGEPAFTTDTHKVYVGDGATNYLLAMASELHTQNTDTLLNIATVLSDDHTYVGITDSKAVGESVVFGDLLYFDWTDGEWKKAKADVAATTPAMRIALESKGDGEACLMLVKGYIRDNSAFEATIAIAYLSITVAGAVQYSVPSVSGNQVQRVGIFISADIFYFAPSMDVGEI